MMFFQQVQIQMQDPWNGVFEYAHKQIGTLRDADSDSDMATGKQPPLRYADGDLDMVGR